jgi:ferredoxin, 2Fe-2S
MPKVRFILHNGAEHLVDGEVGTSIMQIAVNNMVPDIIGDCGGNCSCATCHGYVDSAWIGRLAPMSETEAALLDGAIRVQADSRLTCQIKLTRELDGIVVRLPISQV